MLLFCCTFMPVHRNLTDSAQVSHRFHPYGFETAEEIRKSDTDVSIVFCTSYYTITNAGKGFEVAAEDFLSKPLLYRKVENILNKIYK